MKISLLNIILLCFSATVVGQSFSADSLRGKWECVNVYMDRGLFFDTENLDSTHKNFLKLSKQRPGQTSWTEEDSIGAENRYQEFKSHLEKTYIVFHKNGTYTTNFFSEQVDSIKGTYKFSSKTNELLLYTDDHMLDRSMTKISILNNARLTFICQGKTCEILRTTFKKTKSCCL